MRAKRSRQLSEAAKRHKSAKRELKKGRRFIQQPEYYEDVVTGKAYPGEMPAPLKAMYVRQP